MRPVAFTHRPLRHIPLACVYSLPKGCSRTSSRVCNRPSEGVCPDRASAQQELNIYEYEIVSDGVERGRTRTRRPQGAKAENRDFMNVSTYGGNVEKDSVGGMPVRLIIWPSRMAGR